jgi:hypothetical protein
LGEPKSIIAIVWWLWLLPALTVLLLPVQWYFALLTRGSESVLASGIGGDGFALVAATVVAFVFGSPPLVLFSLVYGFLFWRHRRRGVALSARHWVPIYGIVLILALFAGMAFVTLSASGRA